MTWKIEPSIRERVSALWQQLYDMQWNDPEADASGILREIEMLTAYERQNLTHEPNF